MSEFYEKSRQTSKICASWAIAKSRRLFLIACEIVAQIFLRAAYRIDRCGKFSRNVAHVGVRKVVKMRVPRLTSGTPIKSEERVASLETRRADPALVLAWNNITEAEWKGRRKGREDEWQIDRSRAKGRACLQTSLQPSERFSRRARRSHPNPRWHWHLAILPLVRQLARWESWADSGTGSSMQAASSAFVRTERSVQLESFSPLPSGSFCPSHLCQPNVSQRLSLLLIQLSSQWQTRRLCSVSSPSLTLSLSLSLCHGPNVFFYHLVCEGAKGKGVKIVAQLIRLSRGEAVA